MCNMSVEKKAREKGRKKLNVFECVSVYVSMSDKNNRFAALATHSQLYYGTNDNGGVCSVFFCYSYFISFFPFFVRMPGKVSQ